MVRHKISGLMAQVHKHYKDNDDYVGVIVLPQAGVNGSARFQKWRIDELAPPNS
jgi:hypothetical protein